MADILSISVDTRKVENMLNGYVRNLPKLQDRVPKKIARMYAAMYLTQLPRSKISPFTGHLFTKLQSQMTNPVKLGKGSYGVEVPLHGIYLDRMRPHWVSLKRGRIITLWAKTKMKYYRKGMRSVFVIPHPWIRSANIRGGMNVRGIAEFEVNKFLQSRGR